MRSRRVALWTPIFGWQKQSNRVPVVATTNRCLSSNEASRRQRLEQQTLARACLWTRIHIHCPTRDQRFISFSSQSSSVDSTDSSKGEGSRADVTLLKNDTEQYITDNNTDTSQLIELMKQWMEIDEDQSLERAESLESLLQHWLNQYKTNGTKVPDSSLPFEWTLWAWHRVGHGDNAASVLDEWWHYLEGNMTLAPSLDAFHKVMDAYSIETDPSAALEKSSPEEALEAVEKLLLLLEQWHTGGSLWCQPRVETFAHVLRVMVQQLQDLSVLSRTQELLQKLRHTYQSSQELEPVDVYFLVRAYSDTISFISNTTDMDSLSAAKMSSLLMEMEACIRGQDLELISRQENTFTRTSNDALEISLGRAYQLLLRQYRREPREEDAAMTARNMEDLVNRLEGVVGEWSVLPSQQHYKMAIDAWAENASSVAPKEVKKSRREEQTHCEDLLRRMEDRCTRSSGENTTLSLEPYERVLYAMSKYGRGEKAQSILLHAMELLEQKRLASEHKDSLLTHCWNHAMTACVNDDNDNNGVLNLWGKLKEPSFKNKVKPDRYTYTTVLAALSASTDRSAAPRAHSIWKQMLNNRRPEPTAIHYGLVISAWSRSSHDRNAAEKAQSVLDRLVSECKNNPIPELKPRTSHYTAVITAWGRSRHPDAIKKAEELFEQMKTLAHHESDLEPDAVCYTAMMVALSRSKSGLRPGEAAEKAEALLDHLETISQQEGKDHMQPNKISYTTVIDAWGKSGVVDGPERAQAIYQRLEDAYSKTQDESLLPDTYVYAAMLGAWANSKLAHAGDRAEELLNQIEQEELESDTTSVALNNIVYSKVICAHWKSGRPNAGERAEAILNRMEKLCTHDGIVDVKPDTFAFTCVIQAWAKSDSPEKAQHAWNLFQRMCRLYKDGNVDVAPNVITVTAVLNACAYAKAATNAEQQQAVKIALQAMMELGPQSKYGIPNHVTFKTLLLVFGRQIHDKAERFRLASSAFEQCVKHGQVDRDVVNVIRIHVPELYRTLPREARGKLLLPDEWCRNVARR